LRFHLDDEALVTDLNRARSLLVGKNAVVAIGNKLLLSSFCVGPLIKPYLICGCTTEEEAFAECREHQPDLLYATDDLEQGNGISLIKAVKTFSPDTNCLLFTDRETTSVTRDAIAAGTNGVVFLSSLGSKEHGDFLPAVEAMVTGGVYYPDEVRKAAGFTFQQIPDLTAREDEVLKALCLGLSNKAIAERLVLTSETIKSHVSSIISKMGANDRLDAVVKAIRMGY